MDRVPNSLTKTPDPVGQEVASFSSIRSSSPTVEDRLFSEPFAYRFFQAVRLLERLSPQHQSVGRGGPPKAEVVRFRVHQSLSFPPSEIYELERPTPSLSIPVMTVAFMGLTGPSGALPRHYTEFVLRHQKEADDAEKFALRDWFDLFNHRLISLFFRAWEKYRFYIPYERGEYRRAEPDPYTLCLFSLIGLGVPALRQRLRVSIADEEEEQRRERVLAEIKDLALVHYSGHLAHQVRTALGLEAVLKDYFQFQVEVQQFRGQWLQLDAANQSCMGEGSRTCELGVNLVAGDRVWDVQGKFRVRIGPLGYAQFTSLIPDRAWVLEQKTFFLLAHLIRLFVGPDLDFDVQLVLRAADIPPCRMEESPTFSPRLGWNTWIANEPFSRDADDSVFEGETVRWLNDSASFAAD